jgi:hypothetical protein
MGRQWIAMTGLALLLAGCSQLAETSGPEQAGHGRYAGIGIYAADKLWAKLAGAPAPKDPALAKLEDDGMIFVVTDTHTGEVRQCGNRSGYCTPMNPWKGQAPAK